MTQFNPQSAINTIRESYLEIEKVGKVLVDKKKQYVLFEAQLIDAETQALNEYFKDKPCKISELSGWIKSKIWVERATEAQCKSEIRALETELEIRVECLNSVKMSFKISLAEQQNLNYLHD